MRAISTSSIFGSRVTALVRSLIPQQPKKPDEEQEYAPNLKPDQVKFDEKAKKGKKFR